MIKLETEDYCQKCNHFESDVEEPIVLYHGLNSITYCGDFIIRCKHREICENLIKTLGGKDDKMNFKEELEEILRKYVPIMENKEQYENTNKLLMIKLEDLHEKYTED